MADRSEIQQARRALGTQLALLRKAAGLTQHNLAAKIDGYGRSTVANAETGHQVAHRDFWLRCDTALTANGALITAYDRLRELVRTSYLEDADLANEATFRRTPESNGHDLGAPAARDGDGRRIDLVDFPRPASVDLAGRANADMLSTAAAPSTGSDLGGPNYSVTGVAMNSPATLDGPASTASVGQLADLRLANPSGHGLGEHSFLTVTRILATQRQAVPPAALLTMIEAHRDTLTTLHARAGDAPVAADIGLMIGETSIVASRLWSAIGNRGLAVAHCAYARQLGERLSHSSTPSIRESAIVLGATARIFESNLRSDAASLIGTDGDIALGLRLLDEAATAAHLLSASARARIAAEQAQTYAVLQLPAECEGALDRARRAVDDIDMPEAGLFSDWNHARLLVYEGTCLLVLGQPRQSVDVLSQAIRQVQADSSNVNVVLAARVDLASAYAASGELEHGCHLLADTYTDLAALGNRRGIERARGARRRLEPWREEPAVKELDDRIAAA